LGGAWAWWEYYVDKVKTGGMATPNLDNITNEYLAKYGKDG
jgi:hypothetical protein